MTIKILARTIKTAALLLPCSALLSACATATLQEAENNDPWQGWNKDVQSFNENFDTDLIKPLALEYLDITSPRVEKSVSNFFSNINDLNQTVNNFLQLKPLDSGMDLSRFVINTTLGIGGLIDWASDFDLPKHQEDVGQTLAYWGIPSGPYLVLPFFGPSTPRDTFGLIGDAILDPLTYVSIFGGGAGFGATVFTSTLDIADTRASLLTKEKVLDEATTTPGERYDFIKSTYLQHRDYQIHDGELNQDDPLNNPQ
jgi:phospholipid-binding lipoprotein MlaA